MSRMSISPYVTCRLSLICSSPCNKHACDREGVTDGNFGPKSATAQKRLKGVNVFFFLMEQMIVTMDDSLYVSNFVPAKIETKKGKPSDRDRNTIEGVNNLEGEHTNLLGRRRNSHRLVNMTDSRCHGIWD